MKLKIFYQPGGEKGLIRWSLLLILFMLGIIAQLEIFKTNIIAPIIMIVAAAIIIWFLIRSYLLIDKKEILIHSPLKKQKQIIKMSDVSSVKAGKYYLVMNFKSSEYFPLRIIAFPRSITKMSSLLNK